MVVLVPQYVLLPTQQEMWLKMILPTIPVSEYEMRKIAIQNLMAKYKFDILFFFGDNYIASPDDEIARETEALMKLITEKNISSSDCYFLTPTYEMQIQTKRNVPRKNLANTQRIATVIKKTLKDRCQLLDGLELMKDSAFYDGNELLKRILIEGKPGCSGAASNDNIHICGEAAKDLAQKVCRILNHY